MSAINMEKYVKELKHTPKCVIYWEAMEAAIEKPETQLGGNEEENDFEENTTSHQEDPRQEGLSDDRHAPY
jgi:hypothetical protein